VVLKVDIEELLDTPETCRLLGVTRVSLWRLEKQGKLRPLRIGRGLRYLPAEVQAYIDRLARERPGTAKRRQVVSK
jgi:predicted DNA-binding transcriptional regulator AlpA